MKRWVARVLVGLGLDSQSDPEEDRRYQAAQVRLRPNRFWVTILPALGVVLTSYLVTAATFTHHEGQGPAFFAIFSCGLVVSACLVYYAGWAYYIEFDVSRIHQARFFGFGDRHVSMHEVKRVTLRSRQSATSMARVRIVCIIWPGGEIGLGTGLYRKRGLAELMRRLERAGAHVDERVRHELLMDGSKWSLARELFED